MKKTIESTQPLPLKDVASTLTGFANQFETDVLDKKARKQLESRNDYAPDALLEMIIHLAEQDGGNVLGTPFDTVKARATLTHVSEARVAINVTRQLLQRMEDDLVQQRITVADPAFAIYTSLRRLVNTAKGNALKPAYEQMKSAVKNRPPKTRSRKKKAAATANGNPAPAGKPAVDPSTTVPHPAEGTGSVTTHA